MNMRPSESTEFNDIFAHKGPVLVDRLIILKAVLKSVSKRRTLARERLNAKDGKHCAMGCFFADNKKTAVSTNVFEQIAVVNDSLSNRANPKTRWKMVVKWLRSEIAKLESASETKGE